MNEMNGISTAATHLRLHYDTDSSRSYQDDFVYMCMDIVVYVLKYAIINEQDDM